MQKCPVPPATSHFLLPFRGMLMTLAYLIVGGIAGLLLIYLLVPLFFPERFQ